MRVQEGSQEAAGRNIATAIAAYMRVAPKRNRSCIQFASGLEIGVLRIAAGASGLMVETCCRLMLRMVIRILV